MEFSEYNWATTSGHYFLCTLYYESVYPKYFLKRREEQKRRLLNSVHCLIPYIAVYITCLTILFLTPLEIDLPCNISSSTSVNQGRINYCLTFLHFI